MSPRSELPRRRNECELSFCQNVGKTCIETYDVIKMAFEEVSMSRTQVFEWFRCFKEGRTYVEQGANFEERQKVLLIVFVGQDGVVHHEFVPEGHAINKEYYLQVPRRLREAVPRKPPDSWPSENRQIHHDNAPAHSSQLVQHFLANTKSNTRSNLHILPILHRVTFFHFSK